MELLEEILAGGQYVKRPLPVMVRFADEAGQLSTLEGLVAYRPGDAIVAGIQAEQWPIDRQRFDATYAVFDPIAHGQDGRYVKKPGLVHAILNSRPRQIPLDNGRDTILARAGDWLVADATGSIWAVAPTIFAATYERWDAPA